MSYRYLNYNTGVSFFIGFGSLPQVVIRDNVSAAPCFTSRNAWTGTVSSVWENSGNWSCGSLPYANTDVIISAGLRNYPVVNSKAVCRSMNEQAGASVKVNGNFQLTIAGKPNR